MDYSLELIGIELKQSKSLLRSHKYCNDAALIDKTISLEGALAVLNGGASNSSMDLSIEYLQKVKGMIQKMIMEYRRYLHELEEYGLDWQIKDANSEIFRYQKEAESINNAIETLRAEK